MKKSIYLKLVQSYLIVISLVVLLTSSAAYATVKRNVNDELSKTSLNMITSAVDSIDNLLIRKIENSIYGMLTNSEYFKKLYNKDIYGNSTELLKFSKELDNIVSINDCISSIYVYYPKTGLIVNNRQFTTYSTALELHHMDLEWLQPFIENDDFTNLDFSNRYWLDTRMQTDREKGTYFLKKENVISYIRLFPPFADTKNMLMGIVAVNIAESRIQNILRSLISSDMESLFIINNKGIIVSHTNDEFINKAIYDVYNLGSHLDRINNLRSGCFELKINNQQYLLSFTTSGLTEWKYITLIPFKRAFNLTYYIVTTIIIVSVAAYIVGLIISLSYVKRIYSPIEYLAILSMDILNQTGYRQKMKNKNHMQESEYSVIQNAMSELQQKVVSMENKFNENIPQIKNNFVLNLVNGCIDDYREIQYKLNLFGIENLKSCYKLILFSIDGYDRMKERIQNKQMEFIRLGLIDIIQTSFKNNKINIIAADNGMNEFINIINYEKLQISDKAILDIIKDIQRIFKESYNISISAGVGSECTSLINIGTSYSEAKNALKYNFIYGDGKILIYSEISRKHIYYEFDSKPYFNNMVKYINSMDINGSKRALENMLKDLLNGGYEIECIQYNLKRLIEYLFDTYNVNGEWKEDTKIYEIAHIQYRKLRDLDDYKELVQMVLVTIIESIQKKNNDINNKLVQGVSKYVQENITKTLSVEEIAQNFYISPSNLHKIFKEQTGETINSFIINERMKMARVMLEKGIKIGDIAEKLNYCNTQYFIRQFKMYHGKTPKQFQVEYIGNSLLDN